MSSFQLRPGCYQVPSNAEMVEFLYNEYVYMKACKAASGASEDACPLFLPSGIEEGQFLQWDGTKLIGVELNLKASQAITFNSLASKFVGDADFALNATASSGLAVTYTSSNTSVATISGNTVHIVGAGTTNIIAHQAGNSSFNAAADVSRPLVVSTPIVAYWGWSNVNTAPSESDILNFPGTGSFAHNTTITANFAGSAGPKYLFMAEPTGETAKTRWYQSDVNTNLIGNTETFKLLGTVGQFRVYVSTFPTEFSSPVQFKIS